MRLESSHDENGPLSYLGELEFSADTGLPTGCQKFSLPTYVASSDEAQMVVEYNGHRLTDFGIRNDYYGFGTSPVSVLNDAAKDLDRLYGINADICLIVTLKRTLVIAADKAPFYRGAQAVHSIPWTWKLETQVERETTQDFLVWQNGHRTPQALDFYDEIIRLSSEDAAPARNGDLLTVATRKIPTPRDQFLVRNCAAT